MKCQNIYCNKEEILLFKLSNGNCVCENCALISGMSKQEIEDIKQEAKSI